MKEIIDRLLKVADMSNTLYGRQGVFAPLYWKNSYHHIYNDRGGAGPNTSSLYAPLETQWVDHFRAEYSIRATKFRELAQRATMSALDAAFDEMPRHSTKCPVTLGVNVYDTFYEIAIKKFTSHDFSFGNLVSSDEFHWELKNMTEIELLDLSILCTVIENIVSTGQVFVHLNTAIQNMRIEWQRPFVPSAGFYGRKRRLGIS